MEGMNENGRRVEVGLCFSSPAHLPKSCLFLFLSSSPLDLLLLLFDLDLDINCHEDETPIERSQMVEK